MWALTSAFFCEASSSLEEVRVDVVELLGA